MKTVNFTNKRKHDILHVDTDLGIVNIYVGLEDSDGHRVNTIEIIPNNYSGEPSVRVDGNHAIRLVEEKS